MSFVIDSTVQTDVFKTMKLPPVFMQAFSVANDLVKCIKCNFSCKPIAENVLFHLTVCNGSLDVKKIDLVNKYNCLICNFKADDNVEWTRHLLKVRHISNSFDSNSTGYSYDCSVCDTHFYGTEDAIFDHPCKPRTLSKLSFLMRHVYERFNVQEKHMLYYCTDCTRYADDLADLHVKDCRDVAENSPSVVCTSCRITFYGSDDGSYVKHGVYFEHSALGCLNGDRIVPKSLKSVFWQLPLQIAKYFVASWLLDQFCCAVCGEVGTLTYRGVYDHFVSCVCSKGVSAVSGDSLVKLIICQPCDYRYQCSDVGQDGYARWVDHVVSVGHLRKTIVEGDTHYLYTYYCPLNEAILFGTAFSIQQHLWQTNDELGRLLFVPEFMADVYRRADNYSQFSTLHCCGLCLYYTDGEFCRHQNDDPCRTFHCPTCLVHFNVRADYDEHLFSSEHIILRYFAPDRTETLEPKTTRRVDDDASSDRMGGGDRRTADGGATCPDGERAPRTPSPSRDLGPKVILGLVNRLSEVAVKSNYTSFLKMKLEFLHETPHLMKAFFESKSYYCAVCDLVFMDQLIWNRHDAEFHADVENLSTTYCEVCHVYYVNAAADIGEHVDGPEHDVMLDFRKRIKTKPAEPITAVGSSPAGDLKTANGEGKPAVAIKNSKNTRVYVKIKDVRTGSRRADRESLRKLVLEKYGQCKLIPNRGNLFIIIFENVVQVEAFVNDKNELENKYRVKVEVFGENENKTLSLKTVDVLCNWLKLCSINFYELKTMNTLASCQKVKAQVEKLCDSVKSLSVGAESTDVYVFGSRLYELATETSKIDLYVNTNGTFYGEIASDNDLQVSLVKLFAKQCRLNWLEFTKIREVCDASVPIVKFYHVPTDLNCNVSFKSGLSLWNSKLIKSYLSIDTTVKWLVCYVVRIWAPQNGFTRGNLFTSYALVWLVLFYLMTIKVIPPVVELVKCATEHSHKIIEGWDCSIGTWTDGIIAQDRSKLLMGFFQYYAIETRLMDNVLCTYTGQLMCKNRFFMQFNQLPEISHVQRNTFNSFELKVSLNFEKFQGLTVQDPYDLAFNITKNITSSNLADFCNLCDQSAKLLGNDF